jgi:hypothetical protein
MVVGIAGKTEMGTAMAGATATAMARSSCYRFRRTIRQVQETCLIYLSL